MTLLHWSWYIHHALTRVWNNLQINGITTLCRLVKIKGPLQLIEIDKLSHSSIRDHDINDEGDFYGVDEHGPVGELQTNNNVVVPNLDFDFEDLVGITNDIDFLADDGNHGINIYEQVQGHLKTLTEGAV